MSFYTSGKLFSSHKWDTKVKSANVKNSERWIGYFFGPAGVIILNAIMAQYLNVYWTDVLKINGLWGGAFVLVFPILSKVVDAITNVIMGQIIDRTKSRQGKARPWLIFAGPIVAIGAILSFSVPNASTTVQAIWIMFSYNLYYSIGYTIYYMSHTMLVPLSTRNTKQRDGLAMLSNMALSIIPGFCVAMLFPSLLLPALGVDQEKWMKAIVVFSRRKRRARSRKTGSDKRTAESMLFQQILGDYHGCHDCDPACYKCAEYKSSLLLQLGSWNI